MLILNLGCGVKTSDRVMNIDWSLYLRLQKNRTLAAMASPFMSAHRKERLGKLKDKKIRVHNLAKGIPYDDNSVDAVYHSHLLEHLDRDTGRAFLAEIRRVLVPGGILRIVVPDLEQLAERYLQHLRQCPDDPDEAQVAEHDKRVCKMIEQLVRTERFGTRQQKNGLVRAVDRIVLGDARKQGEIHQWMYDRVSLKSILEKLGYSDVKICTWKESQIPDWEKIGLDISEKDPSLPHKKFSLYIEAKK